GSANEDGPDPSVTPRIGLREPEREELLLRTRERSTPVLLGKGSRGARRLLREGPHGQARGEVREEARRRIFLPAQGGAGESDPGAWDSIQGVDAVGVESTGEEIERNLAQHSRCAKIGLRCLGETASQFLGILRSSKGELKERALLMEKARREKARAQPAPRRQSVPGSNTSSSRDVANPYRTKKASAVANEVELANPGIASNKGKSFVSEGGVPVEGADYAGAITDAGLASPSAEVAPAPAVDLVRRSPTARRTMEDVPTGPGLTSPASEAAPAVARVPVTYRPPRQLEGCGAKETTGAHVRWAFALLVVTTVGAALFLCRPCRGRPRRVREDSARPDAAIDGVGSIGARARLKPEAPAFSSGAAPAAVADPVQAAATTKCGTGIHPDIQDEDGAAPSATRAGEASSTSSPEAVGKKQGSRPSSPAGAQSECDAALPAASAATSPASGPVTKSDVMSPPPVRAGSAVDDPNSSPRSTSDGGESAATVKEA
ncbi:unnamed protein product, partial [Scytosiphon promiscuus]